MDKLTEGRTESLTERQRHKEEQMGQIDRQVELVSNTAYHLPRKKRLL